MASPEIDEAAAVFFAEHATHSNWTSANLARAALRWKARAEELAAEEEDIEFVRGECANAAIGMKAERDAAIARAEKLEAELRSVEAQVGDYARRATNDEQALLARAKAAEAEVKRLEDLVSEGHSLFVDHTLCCGNEAQHKEARRVANARQLAQSEKAR